MHMAIKLSVPFCTICAFIFPRQYGETDLQLTRSPPLRVVVYSGVVRAHPATNRLCPLAPGDQSRYTVDPAFV